MKVLRHKIRFLSLIGLALISFGVFSQVTDVYSENRVALVIGNGDYLSGPLTNPVNDARSIARALRNADFEVILRENLSNQAEMKRVIREFGRKLQAGGTGLFYYAGHGIQVNGYNYIIPVNAVINNQEEVEYESVEAGFVLAQMEAARNRVNIVIFDACRNNPFARTFRDVKQGLASMNAPTGTIIAYATSPGSTAADGTGVNGLYTQELLYQIHRPDLKIEEVFKNVRAEVVKKSNRQQTPWESSSLIGDFYFHPDNVPVEKTVVIPETADVTASSTIVEWRATTDGYFLYINGNLITDKTEYYESGNDLIVVNPRTNSRYLLRNYWINRDNRMRPAEIFLSTSADYYSKKSSLASGQSITKAEWRGRRVGDEGEYYLYVNGVEISKETTSTLTVNDLKVYHPLTKTTFLLRDFINNLDYQLRDAEILTATEISRKKTLDTSAKKLKIMWKATNDGTYYLQVNREEISKATTYELRGNDLYVYHLKTNRTFLLKNFLNRLDNIWRKGELLK